MHITYSRSPKRSTRAVLAALGLSVSSAYAADYDCLIEPQQSIEIGSAVTGVVDKVLVKRGDRVRRGQVLAVLESTAESAAAELAKFKSQATGAIEAAQKKIEFGQKKYERLKEMAAHGLVSTQEADNAESELRLAEAELVAAKESREQAALEFKQQSGLLALRTIRSPLDGVVVDQLLHPGETAEPGGKKPLLKLAQVDPLKVRVMLPMAAFGKLKTKSEVEITPEHEPGSRLKATVRHTDKVLDAASATHIVLMDLPNRSGQIPAGVKCRAHLSF